MPGPVPKRSDQRRRRNKPDVEIVSAPGGDATVFGPALEGDHSDVGRRCYERLRRSGQAAFFEESDWAAAELWVIAIDAYVEKRSSMMYAAIQQGMTGLLVTEGDRRRMRVELARPKDEDATGGADDLAAYRSRLSR
jgi:hypothetical protein